jgi:hypothetical protein
MTFVFWLRRGPRIDACAFDEWLEGFANGKRVNTMRPIGTHYRSIS